jgi:hypothetical protein
VDGTSVDNMLNTLLGFLLTDNIAAAVAIAVVSVVILIRLVARTYFGVRRRHPKDHWLASAL